MQWVDDADEINYKSWLSLWITQSASFIEAAGSLIYLFDSVGQKLCVLIGDSKSLCQLGSIPGSLNSERISGLRRRMDRCNLSVEWTKCSEIKQYDSIRLLPIAIVLLWGETPLGRPPLWPLFLSPPSQQARMMTTRSAGRRSCHRVSTTSCTSWPSSGRFCSLLSHPQSTGTAGPASSSPSVWSDCSRLWLVWRQLTRAILT